MYNQYLETKKSKTGFGVFTKVQIPADSAILEFTGSIVPKEKADLDPALYLEVAGGRVIGPSGAADDFINHSCDPNCYVHIVGSRAILYSLYIIPAGSELTFDYSTSSTDTLDSWKMDCACGSFKCRKVISGYQYLDPSLKKEYERKGIVPLFMTMPNLFQKV